MTRHSTALTCTILALLAAGCGSSGNSASSTTGSPSTGAATSSATTTTSSTTGGLSASAGLPAACATARAAEKRYVAAAKALAAKFLSLPDQKKTIAATGVFRRAVEAVASAGAAAQKQQMTQFAVTLARQSVVIGALARHDTATARKYDPGLNTALFEGNAAFTKLCPPF